ncbi:MAG: hypothetical protein FWC62_03055 [Firmicutes bacterium]|nr:hypothetical protein [Bacillota bacterium]
MRHGNILEALYYGNIIPFEKHFERVPEFTKCVEAISDREEKLLSLLDEEQQRLLTELIEAESSLSCLSELEHFVEGFRLGAAFMLDTFLFP